MHLTLHVTWISKTKCWNVAGRMPLITPIFCLYQIVSNFQHLNEWIPKTSEALQEIPKFLFPVHWEFIFYHLHMVKFFSMIRKMLNYVQQNWRTGKGITMCSFPMAAVISSHKHSTLKTTLPVPQFWRLEVWNRYWLAKLKISVHRYFWSHPGRMYFPQMSFPPSRGFYFL